MRTRRNPRGAGAHLLLLRGAAMSYQSVFIICMTEGATVEAGTVRRAARLMNEFRGRGKRLPVELETKLPRIEAHISLITA